MSFILRINDYDGSNGFDKRIHFSLDGRVVITDQGLDDIAISTRDSYLVLARKQISKMHGYHPCLK